MAETLVAILLVTSSAAGDNLVYRWPPSPQVSPRLCRPRLDKSSPVSDDFLWKPSQAGPPHGGENRIDNILGYSSELLAAMLSPQRAMCHQRFELIVDELAFIGYPVCSEEDGVWRFKTEENKLDFRGRVSRHPGQEEPSRSKESQAKSNGKPCTWLQTFSFILVLDRPDSSSTASGNVAKYFDIIYEQIVFTITAVLFQEQVLSNFVEVECDVLGKINDQFIQKGTPYQDFAIHALEASTLSLTMKTLYEAIKSCSIAYLTINSLPFEVQLPPYLDQLLHSWGDENQDWGYGDNEYDYAAMWGKDMSVGWRLPSLLPWKSLLLLDSGIGAIASLRRSHIASEDQHIAEGLIRFLETINVTLSLADIANILDWDLDTQVFPAVRWLVQRRHAKVVDTVHPGLKTVFSLPPSFDQPLSVLSASFKAAFPSPSIPSLPALLSAISASSSNSSSNTFFASLVRSREYIPMYTSVLLWMLRRDMLITLHLRIRIVVNAELKANVRVQMARERMEKKMLKGGRARKRRDGPDADRKGEPTWLSLSPKSARQHVRKLSKNEPSDIENLFESTTLGGDVEEKNEEDENEEENHDDNFQTEELWDHGEESWSTLISDPARATPLERRWLAAMSEGKDPVIARRFETINQYFDGKKTDDEILYRAEITRKQLREVLHHYDEFLQTFLHPS